MMHVLLAAILFVVGFAGGVLTKKLAQPPAVKVVYCPIGEMGPECVEARRAFDAGRITTPNAAR